MSIPNHTIDLDPENDVLGTRLAGFVHRLAEPRHTIEQTFLDMGERLISCTNLLSEISAAHEGMPAELESAEFTSAAQTLQAIREQLAKMAEVHSSEEDDIVQLTGMAARVKRPLVDLREAVRAIRFVAVNARVVAAGISGAHGTFDGSTTDMGDLGRSVASAVTAFSRSFERLGSSLAVARSANASFTAKHGDTMNYVSGRLAEHLSVLGHHRARAASKATEHAQSIGRISGRVADAVSALQIGDITRQRVEHVEQALDALGGYMGQPASAGTASRASTVSAVCRLQTAQLDETVHNFDAQVGSLTKSISHLAGDTAAVLRENGEEVENLFSKGGMALAALIEDLREISKLFSDFEQTRAGLQKVAGEVAQSVSAMVSLMGDHLDTIREIEQRIRQLSLNTVIQCTRLGEKGDALMVVAQSLRTLAGETVAAAEAIMSGLTEVDALAQRLVQRRTSDTGEDVPALEKDARDAIAMFETVMGRMRACVDTMSTAGPRAVSLLDETVKSVSGRRDFADGWRSVHAELEHLVPADFVPLEHAPGIDDGFIARLRTRYTMDSERSLHDRLLGAPKQASAAAALPESEGNLGDIFF